MAFTRKSDFTFKHSEQADEPSYAETSDLKADLDSQAKELRDYTNGTLLTELEAPTASANIGAVVGGVSSTVQEFIDAVEEAGTGSLPPAGTVTNIMLASDIKIGSNASLPTTDKSSIVNSIIEFFNSVNSKFGNLTTLATTTKDSIVNSINEIVNGDVGKIEYFAMNTAPSGRLEANGSAVSRTTYARLFAKIGTTYGAGDGSTTFNLPDLRGVFPRGWDNGKGYDSGRVFGSYQADDNKAHTHTGTTGTESSQHTHSNNFGLTSQYAGGGAAGSTVMGIGGPSNTSVESTTHTHDFTTSSVGSTEVKVKNIALLATIKF